MAWLRIDDKFPSHPKVAQLSDREFRVHLRVLCYCALYDTRGRLPESVWAEVVGLTRAMGRKFLALGLWDEDDATGALAVHDFEFYNPKDPAHAARQKRYRERHRNGTSDEERDAPVTPSVTPSVTETVTPDVTPPAPARARGPSPKDQSQSLSGSHYEGTAGDFQMPENLLRTTP